MHTWDAPVTTMVFWDRTAWTCTAAAMLLRLWAALMGDCTPPRSFLEARERPPTVFWCGESMQQILDQVASNKIRFALNFRSKSE